jgi:hypothetical protein
MQNILLCPKTYSISEMLKDPEAFKDLLMGYPSGSYIHSIWNLSESRSGVPVNSTDYGASLPNPIPPKVPDRASRE